VYGVVGAHYTPLQNREAFQFFDPIVGEGAAIYHTVGALGNGEHVWILAKLPGHIHVVGDDIAEKYLLISNSHDGKSSVRVKFTPVRVVCQNTLTMALKRGSVVRVAHTKSVVDNLKNAREMLGIINSGFQEFEVLYTKMADLLVDSSLLDRYLRAVFPDPENHDGEKAREIAGQHRAWAEHFFAEGRGNQEKGVKGTLWAAYTGVTEYVDHHRGKKTSEQHLYSVWFGAGYQIKSRAFESAVGLLPNAALV
jgi:phage/plasmid-like protein (TIGR03299 family)